MVTFAKSGPTDARLKFVYDIDSWSPYFSHINRFFASCRWLSLRWPNCSSASNCFFISQRLFNYLTTNNNECVLCWNYILFFAKKLKRSSKSTSVKFSRHFGSNNDWPRKSIWGIGNKTIWRHDMPKYWWASIKCDACLQVIKSSLFQPAAVAVRKLQNFFISTRVSSSVTKCLDYFSLFGYLPFTETLHSSIKNCKSR